MPTLQQTIDADWKTAMKARDPSKDTLALVRTELKNKAISTREAGSTSTEVGDDVALEVLGKMAKQRRESIAEYQKGGRDDLVDKETAELSVVEKYLPEMLGDDELEAIVKAVIADVGASSMKEMGKVMGPVMAKVKGKADGGQVQAMVKKALG